MADYERFRVSLSNLRGEAEELVRRLGAREVSDDLDRECLKLLDEVDALLDEMAAQGFDPKANPQTTENHQVLIFRVQDITAHYETRVGHSKLH